MIALRNRAPSRFSVHPLHSLLGGALVACAAVAMQPALAQVRPPQTQAEPHEHHHKHHRHHRHGAEHGGAAMFGSHRMERMLDAVDASEAQRSQIRQIVASAAPQMKELRQRGRALREQAQRVMIAPVIDANAAEQLRMQMVAHHDAVSKQRLDVMLQVAQQLTPEQRAKIGEMMAQRKTRMQQRHERRHVPQASPATPSS